MPTIKLKDAKNSTPLQFELNHILNSSLLKMMKNLTLEKKL